MTRFQRIIAFMASPLVGWVTAVAVGVLAGWLGATVASPSQIWSWRTLTASLVTGIATVFLWWISAPGYEPFKAGLGKFIWTSSGIAAVSTIAWVAFLTRR